MLIADVHLSLHPPRPLPYLGSSLLWSRAHLGQLPFPSCAHLSGLQTSLLTFLPPLLCPSPQHQQSLLGNPPATLSLEAGRLTDFHLSLHASRFNSLVSSQLCSRPSAVVSSHSLTLAGNHGADPGATLCFLPSWEAPQAPTASKPSHYSV